MLLLTHKKIHQAQQVVWPHKSCFMCYQIHLLSGFIFD